MKEFYKVPDQQYRKVAFGTLAGTPYRLKKALTQVLPMFQPMSQPKPGEWLWDHQQQGQTFQAYQGQLHNIVDQKRNVIYIKPLQQQVDKQFIDKLKKYCECFFYPMKVKVVKYSNVISKVSSRINQYTQKIQVNAKQILAVLKKNVEPDAFCLIGVTLTDLYPQDEWNFVFGIASIRQRTGVFSFARYDQRFFTQKKFQPDYEKILWRSIGVMIHQITHMFGVRHCIFYNCVMNGSNNDQQSRTRPLELCPVCLRKMQSNIKFDILERYKKIQQYLQIYGKGYKQIVNFKVWIDKIISNIKLSVKQK